MPEPFVVNLLDLQPSQLWINQAKLAAVERRVERSGREPYDALPITRLAGSFVLTDGHTRAFAAFRAGLRQISVIRDRDELDWKAYRICVEWCIEEGVYSVADLTSRVIDSADYEERWLKRCRMMQERLALERQMHDGVRR